MACCDVLVQGQSQKLEQEAFSLFPEVTGTCTWSPPSDNFYTYSHRSCWLQEALTEEKQPHNLLRKLGTRNINEHRDDEGILSESWRVHLSLTSYCGSKYSWETPQEQGQLALLPAVTTCLGAMGLCMVEPHFP